MEAKRFCENCGAETGARANFCPSCGAAQRPDCQLAERINPLPQVGLGGHRQQVLQKKAKTTSSKRFAIIVGMILLLASAVIVGVLLWPRIFPNPLASQLAPPSPELPTTSNDEATTSNDEATTSNGNKGSSASVPSPSPTDKAPTPSENNDAVPAGYILEPSCDNGTGQTGLTIYYKLLPSDSLRYVCYHQADKNPYIGYEDSASFQDLADVGGPYCAFSSVDRNVGCALSPITEQDLMNVPPTQDEEAPAQELPTEKTPAQETTAQKTPAQEFTAPLRAVCQDGYISDSQNRSGSCSHHGGVVKWIY